MKATVSIIIWFSLLCWRLNAQNYVTMSSYTGSSGYLVSADSYGSEIHRTNIYVSDLQTVVKNLGKNPIMVNSNTYSSGYLVGMSSWSNEEIRRVDVSIADLLNMMKNYGKNPIMVKTSDTYSSGYLVGMSGWNNEEIRKVDVSITELTNMIKSVKELKKSFEELQDENEMLKKKVAKLEDNQALIADFIGFVGLRTANIQESNIKAFVDGKMIILEDIQGLPVTVYQINGTLLEKRTNSDNYISIEAPSSGVYIVLAGEEVMKVIVP